jgi:hypothetical protein
MPLEIGINEEGKKGKSRVLVLINISSMGCKRRGEPIERRRKKKVGKGWNEKDRTGRKKKKKKKNKEEYRRKTKIIMIMMTLYLEQEKRKGEEEERKKKKRKKKGREKKKKNKVYIHTKKTNQNHYINPTHSISSRKREISKSGTTLTKEESVRYGMLHS